MSGVDPGSSSDILSLQVSGFGGCFECFQLVYYNNSRFMNDRMVFFARAKTSREKVELIIIYTCIIYQWRMQDLTLGGRGLCQRGAPPGSASVYVMFVMSLVENCNFWMSMWRSAFKITRLLRTACGLNTPWILRTKRGGSPNKYRLLMLKCLCLVKSYHH